MLKRIGGVVAIAVSLGTAGSVRAERYSVTDLGTLGGGYSVARDINDRGQVVGWSYTKGGSEHAFLYSGGKLSDLGTLGGSWSRAYGINNVGQVVGDSQIVFGGSNHAFLYDGGKMTGFGGAGSGALGVNDAGQIAGYVRTPTGREQAFVTEGGSLRRIRNPRAVAVNASGQAALYDQWYDGKSVRQLPGLPGAHPYPTDLNDAGHVVGSYQDGFGYRHHPFLAKDGKLIDLGALPGKTGGSAYGVNDAGDVVGSSYSGNNRHSEERRAFLYRDGKMVDLNSLIPPDSHLKLLDALAINNQGQIVGQALTRNGEYRPFLLTPAEVPEPTSLALLGMGAAGLAGYAWKRRRASGSAAA